MTANTTPIFTLTPQLGIEQISTANSNRDGSGVLSSGIVTGATDGTRITQIRIIAAGTTTAGVVRLYIYDGANTRLWREVLVNAITPSSSVQVFDYTLELFGERALILPSSYELRASTENAETFNVFAEAADY